MIRIEYDDSEVKAALSRLAGRAKNLRQAMAGIGGIVRADIMERFDTSTTPDGQSWKPLTLAAIISRARRHAPSGMKKRRGKTLARFSANAKPLLDTGQLRNSIKTLSVSGDSVIVGTRLPYAAIHHFGGNAGRGRKAAIPARPFMGVSAEGKREILGLIRRHLEAA